MNLALFLEYSARRVPRNPAIMVGTQMFTDYAGLAKKVTSLAAYFHAHGLVPGDRVAVTMTNNPDYLVVMYAAWHAGLCVVPVNARLHQMEFAYIFEQAGVKMCFYSHDLAETIGPLGERIRGLEVVEAPSPAYARMLAHDPASITEVGPDSAAWLFYTSGTTGRPKGATLTHRNLNRVILSYLADIDSLSERDGIVHAAPMSHGSGMCGLPHMARGARHIIPESGGYDSEEIFEILRKNDGISFFAAPTMITRLMSHKGEYRAAGLKTIVYGGAPMYVADIERAIDFFGPKLCQIYGQGESPMTITYLPHRLHLKATETDRQRLGSTGIARTGIEVKVFGEDGKELPYGETGEVVTRSDCVMAGYWGDPAATSATIRDGWLYTGDLGAMDAAGFLTLTDRAKDMIISGGVNIYPREIEEVLMTHKAVHEVAVVGEPNAEWGEQVTAFVTFKPGAAATEEELDKHCIDNIARFKRPKRYIFPKDLPKSNYGKILKRELRLQLK